MPPIQNLFKMNDQPKIVIIGAGLTGLTTAYHLKKEGFEVIVLEQSNEIGGVIKTFNENGFLYEKGPNTGVISNVETVKLLHDLSDSSQLAVANPKAKKRLILKNKKWEPLPNGLWAYIQTPLFSWKDKIRILGEPFRAKGNNQEETLASMVRRRLGNSFLDYAIDPFISGIYAGNPETLIPKYALPKLYQLEQEYGSFIKGTIQKAKLPKTEWEKKVTKEVFSMEGGLQKLTDALSSKIGQHQIETGVTFIKIQPLEKGYTVSYQNGAESPKNLRADIVISTVSVDALESIFPFIASHSIEKIKTLHYAKIVQVAVGFKQWQGMPLDAFGGLIPSKENQSILGILFPSAIFKDRAPEGGALLSVFMGGIKNPQWFDKSDLEIEKVIMEHLQTLLNSNQKPDLLHIFRYEKAIPQYELSSGERFETIAQIENIHKGLYLAGNIRNGIGMADRIKQGTDLAKIIIDQIHA